MKLLLQYKYGYILIVSVIFLLMLSVLAIFSVKRAILDEKLSGNLNNQSLALQAAETALKFCQNVIETESPPVTVVVRDVSGKGFPSEWELKENWSHAGFAKKLPDNMVKNVIVQPQCMIERWRLPRQTGVKPENTGDSYVITARGVGMSSRAVVWLQATVRRGNK